MALEHRNIRFSISGKVRDLPPKRSFLQWYTLSHLAPECRWLFHRGKGAGGKDNLNSLSWLRMRIPTPPHPKNLYGVVLHYVQENNLP
jgi:hypothetical protein